MATRLAVLLAAGALQEVQGHGWITSPPPRQSSNCQHCLNGPQTCGAADATDNYKGPVVTWREGSIVEVTVAVTAHHKGHYEFSVCDQVITSSTANAQACLDSHILERASAQEAGVTNCQPGDSRAACQPIDQRHKERFYLPPPGFSGNNDNTHTFYLKLPAGLTCTACTMQWRWWSANSCIAAPDYACFKDTLEANGYSNAGDWGLTNWAVKSCPGGGCDRCGCGEEFRNCVDITIEGNGGGSAPSPTNAPATTATPATTTTTTRVATTAPMTGCSVTAVGGNTFGATPDRCQKACSYLAAGEWPCTSNGPCVCNGAAQPQPQPQPQPTPSPTPAPTPASVGAQCGSCSGCLWTQHNACYTSWTQSVCARYAADGYEWCR